MKLEVKGVDFSYDTTPVLKDVSLALESGNLLAILGPNGSGKTTLLKCINRILKPQKGHILLDGKDLRDFGREEIARNLGYVSQRETQSFPSTVFDTVLMGRKPYINWRPGPKDLEVVSETLQVLNLEDLAMKEINRLSGGERQKVMVARALAQEPAVLLLDEPTRNLDLKHQLEVLDIVKKQVTERGISCLMAIHDLNLAARYSDKIVILHDGEIFATGGLEVLTPENIEPVYGVKVRVSEDGGNLLVIPEPS